MLSLTWVSYLSDKDAAVFLLNGIAASFKYIDFKLYSSNGSIFHYYLHWWEVISKEILAKTFCTCLFTILPVSYTNFLGMIHFDLGLKAISSLQGISPHNCFPLLAMGTKSQMKHFLTLKSLASTWGWGKKKSRYSLYRRETLYCYIYVQDKQVCGECDDWGR